MAKEKVEPIPANIQADIEKYPAAMAILYEKKLVGMSNLTETEVIIQQRQEVTKLLTYAKSLISNL